MQRLEQSDISSRKRFDIASKKAQRIADIYSRAANRELVKVEPMPEPIPETHVTGKHSFTVHPCVAKFEIVDGTKWKITYWHSILGGVCVRCYESIPSPKYSDGNTPIQINATKIKEPGESF